MRLPFTFRVWPARLLLRYLIILTSVLFIVANFFLYGNSELARFIRGPGRPIREYYFVLYPQNGESHPIDVLVHEARARHDKLLTGRSFDVPHAAARYRERRGRHPPPGFDKWVEAALATDAIVVEEFFDRIYHDVSPFWALDPAKLRRRANDWHHVVRVRNGTASADGDVTGRVAWLQLWTSLVAEIADHLPDVDMPINYMDESRLLVPHENITKYVKVERRMRRLLPTDEVRQTYGNGLEEVDAGRGLPYEPHWITGPSHEYWDFARVTCSPSSPARGVATMNDFSLPPSFPYNWQPSYTFKGYVRNFSAARDPCTQPHLRSLHGTFIEPVSISTTTELIPLFGGSKMPNNNEILIPGAMYLTDDPFYSGGDTHGLDWHRKRDEIVWRGAASGGRNKRDNWTHFHRHRLVEMLNSTTVARLEANGVRAMTFEMPPVDRYPMLRRSENLIGAWLKHFADAGFVDLLCFPKDDCSYLEDNFKTVPHRSMAEQYEYKFLPDTDGNSFSARFRGFLLSTSLPLKATIYTEWHDDRLIPWLHFVPLDNTFQDLYGVLDFFVGGNKAIEGRTADISTYTSRRMRLKGDLAGRWIAEEGKEWGEKVLRREDMRLYIWRLLLEWARVVDDNREILGYVDDLLRGGGRFSVFDTDNV